MTKKDFTEVMAYLAAGINQTISKERAEVYWDLLRDLPVDVLRTAAKRTILEHPWSTFPSVAELRQAASDTILGQISEMSAADAWAQAWRAARGMDFDIQGPYRRRDPKTNEMKEYPSQVASVMDSLHPVVAKAMNSMGLASLVYAKESSVARGQFLRMWEQTREQRRRLAMMPPDLKREIEQRRPVLGGTVGQAISGIGVMPTMENSL